MNKEKIIKKVSLKNGLDLQIYDNSRKISSDAWLINIIFLIEIDIEQNLFNKSGEHPDINDVHKKLGKKIEFKVENIRNFIKNEKTKELKDEIINSYLETNFEYLSHPDFALKFVLRKFVS